jgi:hypothetical protein
MEQRIRMLAAVLGIFLTRIIAAALLLFGTTAHAISLSFSPSSQVESVSTSVYVDLVISGLGDSSAPSLSVFDMDVLYDPTILGLTNVDFGDPVLGDQLDLFGFGSITGVGGVSGATNIFEVSLDSPIDLDNLQLGSFTLARLTFDILDIGTSFLDLANVVLGDSFGSPLEADVNPGSIRGIPEPGTLALLGIGLAGMGFTRRRKKT